MGEACDTRADLFSFGVIMWEASSRYPLLPGFQPSLGGRKGHFSVSVPATPFQMHFSFCSFVLTGLHCLCRKAVKEEEGELAVSIKIAGVSQGTAIITSDDQDHNVCFTAGGNP